jgi:hypothetical protein
MNHAKVTERLQWTMQSEFHIWAKLQELYYVIVAVNLTVE